MGIGNAEIKAKVTGHVLESVMTTNGDIAYYNSGWQRLAVGAQGSVLTVSASDLPSWSSAAAEAPRVIPIEVVALDGASPPETGVNANGWDFMNFATGDKIRFKIRVPANYTPGDNFVLSMLHSTSSNASYDRQFRCTSRLIRPATDAMTGGNTQNFDTGDIAGHATSHMSLITDWAVSSNGQINSIAISVGDIIQFLLTRIAIVGGSEAADAYVYGLEVNYQ